MILPAHGVGGSTDLPIPLDFALVGASWALTISFGVLALAWREPRYADEPPPADPPPRRPWLAALGLVLTGWFLLALYAGPDEGNAGVGALYILVWVGLVPLALLAGHVWRDLSPWRTITAGIRRLIGRPEGLVAWPSWLGYWPAAVGLLAFVWFELASPDPSSVTAVRTWVGVYVGVTLLAGVLLGERWYDRGDPFDVFSRIVSHLSPLVRDGRWAPHDPLRSLPQLPVAPGLVAVLAVLLGSTAFDSFSASPTWQSRDTGVVADSVALAALCVLVGVLFVAAAAATGGVGREHRREMPGLLAHSLVPIVVGYVFAHYLTYLVERGQEVLIGLLDPLGRGWEPLGSLEPAYWLSEHPSILAGIKVGCVVAGHVVAVAAAHDRAVAVLPRDHRLTGQLAMLVLMVGYTFAGLYLLFSV